MGRKITVIGENAFDAARRQFIANPCARTAAHYHNEVSELWAHNAIEHIHAKLMSRETLAWASGVLMVRDVERAKRNRLVPMLRYSVTW